MDRRLIRTKTAPKAITRSWGKYLDGGGVRAANSINSMYRVDAMNIVGGYY